MPIEVLTSDSLAPVRHGFFTRKGGGSSGIYRGLNCGNGSSDQSDIVRLNRARVAQEMAVPPSALLSLHQIHSARVVHVGPEGYSGAKPKADAMVADRPGVALGVLTADCAPVLFADARAGVVGAAHAGWRGALAGVLSATLDAMEDLGAKREETVAAIGPTISLRAYEVGPEFLDVFVAEDEQYSRYFAPGRGDRMHFDLPGFCLDRLRAAGIAEAHWTGHCTYSDESRFFSYRRATHAGEADYGRLISAITL